MMSEVPGLLQRHFDALHRQSGIGVDVIRERGAVSVQGRHELAQLGFAPAQRRPPGLLLPVHPPDGLGGLHSFRPDVPRVDQRGRSLKYELPRGLSARLDVPPRCRGHLGDPSVDLWLTEGQKKADALATHGLCAAALLGVWNFKGRNDFGGVTLLADFDYVAWNGRTVNVVFDSDVMRKQPVRAALDRITEHLQRKGAKVNQVYLPSTPEGEKVGVDDFLLAHTVTELASMVESPRPEPKAAAPVVKLLDEAPPALSRPLDLIGPHAYAATWLWTERTVTESVQKGEVVRHNPPLVLRRRELFVVRDDGVVFGPGADHPLDELGLELRLADPPRDGKLWRARAVAAYRRGQRPDPSDVFRRVASVYDRFIDFGRSLANQAVMCELSACFSLTTWLEAAFTVLGYPWPNGERGSGKTHWGNCWAMTSYLGEVVLTSGTFAALRDAADYGAALLFDDAEGLGDPKRCDPMKRELLLAGNRRGAVIPLKEPRPDGTWTTRWVNAFCPRAFTAINLPDPVLASRSIVVPLVRTGDARRGNADPADLRRWPCDQQALQDDLWAVALMLLTEAGRVWAELDDEENLIGREFEPWRGVLAVARLFDRRGVSELEPRIVEVMQAHRREKLDLIDNDWTVSVVKAVHALAKGDGSDRGDSGDGTSQGVTFAASIVAETIKQLATEDEWSVEWVSPERVGRILRRLRLKSGRTGKKRWYAATLDEAEALARVYGVLPRDQEKRAGTCGDTQRAGYPPPDPTVTPVTTVTTVTQRDTTPQAVSADEVVEWMR